MNTLKHLKRSTFSGALLSATLAGGLFAYSAVANTADNNPGQGVQTNTGQPMTNQQQATSQNNNQQSSSRQLTDTQQRNSSDALSGPQQSSQQDSNEQMQQRSAATAQGENSQQQNPSMNQVDQNNDSALVWTEIYAVYDEELDDAGWTETSVLGAYDEDASASLDADEYVIFVSGLTDASGTQGGTSAGTGQHNAAADAASTNSNQQAMQYSQNQQQAQGAEAPATVVSVLTVAETGLAPAEIEDREVVNYNNDSIGDVEEVVTAPDGTISGLVVGVGGFWGIGEKDVFVPVDEVKAYGDRIVWETFLGAEQLEDLPQYEPEAYTATQ